MSNNLSNYQCIEVPNTLAHLGIQGLTTRAVIPRADIEWIFLGAVLPDIPWILRRAILAFFPGTDPITLRLYAIAQASLAFTLLLAAAVALCSQRPRTVFSILGLNALLHLLLDALQTKWGNGVHLLAPFSWDTWNVGLFWPESWPTYVLTLFGLFYVISIWYQKAWGRPVHLQVPSLRIGSLSLLFLCSYLLLPFAVMPQIVKADAHSIAAIQNPCKGCPVEFDRVQYQADESQDVLMTWAGDYKIKNNHIQNSESVSIKGTFGHNQVVHLNDIYVHTGMNRDYFTYAGLMVVFFIWILAFFPSSRS